MEKKVRQAFANMQARLRDAETHEHFPVEIEEEDLRVVLRWAEKQEPPHRGEPVAVVRDWNHTYKVGRALNFIEQLRDRGDELGEMMYDMLAPLAKEVRDLRMTVFKLRHGEGPWESS